MDFDSLVYPYQIHSAIISRELREFFIRDQQNSIDIKDESNGLNLFSFSFYFHFSIFRTCD